jgi:hypothetical protein
MFPKNRNIEYIKKGLDPEAWNTPRYTSQVNATPAQLTEPTQQR